MNYEVITYAVEDRIATITFEPPRGAQWLHDADG